MAGKAQPKPVEISWVNYDLTKADKERMKKQYAAPESVNEALEALINTGHKVSVAYDGFAKCFAAYAYPTPSNSLNRGMGLSARSSTPLGALKGLCFRHFDIYDGNWRVTESKVKLDDEE